MLHTPSSFVDVIVDVREFSRSYTSLLLPHAHLVGVALDIVVHHRDPLTTHQFSIINSSIG
eukprot:8323861-Heterocapsa_arctica.AAC.1